LVGRFILGAIVGGVVVMGGLVIGAALFPPRGGVAANANAVPEIALTKAETPQTAPEPPALPDPEPQPVPAPEPEPEPEPAPVPEPEPAPLPEPASEPEPAPEPEAASEAEAPVAEAVPSDNATTAQAAASTEIAPDSAPPPQAAVAGAGSRLRETPEDEAAPIEVAEAEPPAALNAPAAVAEPAPAVVDAAPEAPAPLELAEALPEPTAPVQPPAPEPVPAPPVAEAPAEDPVDAEAAPAPPEAETPEPEAPQPAAPEPATPEMVPLPEGPADRLPGALAADMPGNRPTGLPGTALAPAETAPGSGSTGVITGRLPRIGDAPAPAPEAETAEAEPADDRPLARFAATFENPDAKPVVALILIDTGAPDLDRAGLAALPFPVSFALDPLDPATPDHATLYRAAGKEVVMLATGLPEGAQASDVEVAFQSMAQNLPEAVAVMELAAPLFQNNRPLASLVVPVIQDQGRGLVTWDAGLNAADQVARREDVPAATLFRDLAAGGTDRFALRRTLERVVFKAGQDGRVAVAAEASPELVAGLLEWVLEGRGAMVALGPVTAVLRVD
jgi:polysaccharide deacetylase 2 family uncharacterized protein YibQ